MRCLAEWRAAALVVLFVGAVLTAKPLGSGSARLQPLAGLAEALVSPCWASHFFLCGQEKVTKKKATPASGFCFAKLPSLRRCSGGSD